MMFKNRMDKILESYKSNKSPENEENLDLEKGDKLAMFIAAILVFLPVLIIFGAIILIIYVIFTNGIF